MPVVRKVYAYITRSASDAEDVLVFRHRDFPEAGVQVPRGTVEPGEDPAAAVLREVCEECGLCDARLLRELIVDTQPDASDPERTLERHFFHLITPNAPDAWDHTVTGADEDNGLVFCFYWLPRERLGDLWSGFGDHLHLALATDPTP